jgi:hypothetical protein
MMRGRIALAMAAGMLIVGAMTTMAQEPTGVEPQRVEVPEAGVGITLPADWSVDIEMREREDWGLVVDDEEEPFAFWNVFYASVGGRPWCDLTWYPVHPMSLGEHASLTQDLMTPTHVDIERPIERSAVMLPSGDAQRLVVYNEPTDDWTTTYLLDLADGRYLLRCASDERASDDWLSLAESLEAPAVMTPQPSPEPTG